MKTPPMVQSPRFLQFWQWTNHPLRYLDQCVQKYGDCFAARIGFREMVFFSHPDAIAEIFAKADQMDAGVTEVSTRFAMGDTSSLMIDGEPHRKRRQLLMPLFHGERMRAYGDTIRQITHHFSDQWQPGQPIEMFEEMTKITLDVILSTIFGVSEGARCDQIKKALDPFMGSATTPLSYALSIILPSGTDVSNIPTTKMFLKLRQKVDDILYAEIAERRQAIAQHGAVGEDILTMLIIAKDEEGYSLSDEELRDELMTMLLAGHDSSAATLSWALYHIHNTPGVLEKLLLEIDSLGDNADAMTIFKLPYLSAICSESLRLRSAGPTVMARRARQTITIGDYTIAEGTMLAPCNYLTHHRADLYPNPRQFRPERFIERQYGPAEFYPFGGADRRCIGGAFALFEMKLVLTTILRQYDMTIAQKTPIAAVRRGVNISPQGGVKMTLKKRVPVPVSALVS
jgi:cytochrome P450 family 110